MRKSALSGASRALRRWHSGMHFFGTHVTNRIPLLYDSPGSSGMQNCTLLAYTPRGKIEKPVKSRRGLTLPLAQRPRNSRTDVRAEPVYVRHSGHEYDTRHGTSTLEAEGGAPSPNRQIDPSYRPGPQWRLPSGRGGTTRRSNWPKVRGRIFLQQVKRLPQLDQCWLQKTEKRPAPEK